MAEGQTEAKDVRPSPSARRGGFWRRVFPWIAIVVFVVVGFAWSQRVEIADDLIAGELEKQGIPATYEIERIGGQRQVLRNVVIGDPERPDATVERVEVQLGWSFAGPSVRSVTLEKPRIFGRFTDAGLSFGTLDPILFKESAPDAPPSLPDLDVRIVDGRARVASPYGVLGLALDGSGNPSDGFEGQVAALVPDLRFEGCSADRASFFGKITTADSAPHLDGPLRLRALECADRDVALASLDAELDAQFPATFDAAEGMVSLTGGEGRYAEYAAQGIEGDITFTLDRSAATADYDLALVGLDTPQAEVGRLASEGVVRLRDDYARMEWSGEFDGSNLRPGAALDRALAGFGSGASETPIAPLAAKLRGALQRQAQGSSLAGAFTVRRADGGIRVIVPQARWRNRSGAVLAEADRLRWADGGGIAGSFRTGGPDIPRIAGTLETTGRGAATYRIEMAPYEARGASLALPNLRIEQAASGRLVARGDVRLSGPLPGGRADNLAFPIDAVVSPSGAFSAFSRCTPFRFDSLEYANLALDGRELTLCPPSSGSIVRGGGGGPLRIVAGAPSLALSGRLGGTPIQIESGPVGLAWPGVVRASSLAVHLGEQGSGADFVLSDVDAQLGGEEIAGTFADTEAKLVAVPLDIANAQGNWRYAGGRLMLSDATFLLSDRNDPERFYPLDATEGQLTLENSTILAEANLRDRDTQRVVAALDVVHDLTTASGRADLDTDGLLFDGELQPQDITYLAKGVISLVDGRIDGDGWVRWGEGGLTSGGEYSTADLDFAAPFGPVEGASGSLVFTDLLGFETAPGQTFQVRSINPGIEVRDGQVTLALREGFEIDIEEGRWPFMGGSLELMPTRVSFGEGTVRNFTLIVTGLEAAQFVEQFDLANISATGTFDGAMPLVFDKDGGRIVDGRLTSRPPGGNLSYVGELTYEDLSTMANLAFNILRSLDYSKMRITMDGELTGEIVTRVQTEGVRQGEGAERNLITKSLEGVPIELNININAQFYGLIAMLKSFYDPTLIRDARSLGLIDEDGNILAREVRNPPVEVDPEDIQPSESEDKP